MNFPGTHFLFRIIHYKRVIRVRVIEVIVYMSREEDIHNHKGKILLHIHCITYLGFAYLIMAL